MCSNASILFISSLFRFNSDISQVFQGGSGNTQGFLNFFVQRPLCFVFPCLEETFLKTSLRGLEIRHCFPRKFCEATYYLENASYYFDPSSFHKALEIQKEEEWKCKVETKNEVWRGEERRVFYQFIN